MIKFHETPYCHWATGSKHRLWELPRRRTEQSRCFLLCGLWWSLVIKTLLVVGGGDQRWKKPLLDSLLPRLCHTLFTAEMNPFKGLKGFARPCFANEKLPTLSGILLSAWNQRWKPSMTRRVFENAKTGQVTECALSWCLYLSAIPQVIPGWYLNGPQAELWQISHETAVDGLCSWRCSLQPPRQVTTAVEMGYRWSRSMPNLLQNIVNTLR